MDAVAALQDLYTTRDQINDQIQAIEKLLGAEGPPIKPRRTRGPNKPKEPPPDTE